MTRKQAEIALHQRLGLKITKEQVIKIRQLAVKVMDGMPLAEAERKSR
jgi:hypothetical protein